MRIFRIFISYRRADSKSITLAIHQRLKHEKDFDVFQDITSIPDGYDFRTYLRDGVAQCDVLLVIIGDKWLSVTDDKGNRRLDNPDDFVRIEVQAGLRREPDCLILPVLVNNATPPPEDQLPDDLKPLAARQMRRKVRDDDDFDSDMEKIINAIRAFNPTQRPSPYRNPVTTAPTFKANQAVQDYYDALDEQDWIFAEALIGQIERYKQNNPNNLKTFNVHDARQAIAEGVFRQARDEEYDILRIIAQRNPERLLKALDAFWLIYPDYDPDNLYGKIRDNKLVEMRIVKDVPLNNVINEPVAMERDTLLNNAIESARNFRGVKNRDWQPIIMKLGEIDPTTPLPDIEMCLVPVGKFMMGGKGPHDGKPIHEQNISQPYWIARYPVTNEQWQKAVSARIVSLPLGSGIHWYQDKAASQCPVVGVGWSESMKFVHWVNCNLPTEPLWEYAARGVEHWVYPWGNDWQGGSCAIWDGNSGGMPHPVSSKPEGASWVGAMHLSGNVWEWQLSAYQEYPYFGTDEHKLGTRYINNSPVLRGGSWSSRMAPTLHAANRNKNLPSDGLGAVGFRICRFDWSL